jgi:hypothetical protein
MPDLDTDDLAALIKACAADLGDPNLWFTPDGYPDSLALCIIDSIYSTGARYSSVVNVVGPPVRAGSFCPRAVQRRGHGIRAVARV